MKKVLTLTTQWANNMGALLQCYALSKFLNEQDSISCEVIDYLPENYERSWRLIPKPKTWKSAVKNVLKLINIRFIKDKKIRNKKTRAFIDNYIPLTKQQYNRQSIIASPPVGDVYICGSDQIWNFSIFDDMTYYFDFIKRTSNAILLSYAASISDNWNEQQITKVSPLIKRFHRVSIREKGNMSCVVSARGKNDISWVIDPVFLLSASQWDAIAIKPEIEGAYILCYFLNVDKIAVDVIQKIRKETGLPVINLGIDVIDKIGSDKLVRAYGPLEFVGYIKKATYIFTNSFHCSAFSTIFRKNFCFIPKTWANERLISLEEIFGYKVIFDKKMFADFSVANMQIDYSRAEEKSLSFIDSSKDFLLKGIYEQ